MSYTKSVTLEDDFQTAVDRTREVLSEEGFGVITEVDVAQIFAEKIDEDVDEYQILGACNPQKAFEGIELETELGALLPCNVVVYEDGEDVVVSAVDPTVLIDVTGNDDLDDIARDIDERFDRVLATLED
ncbi:MAG: DUF302 domain-containing protein [Halanaeroarchaeum sp.]